MDLKLEDRVAVVTGGSSGIGLATVRRLLSEGARVVSCARGVDRLQRSAAELASAGFGPDRLQVCPCDVTDEPSVAALVDQTARHFGRVDILVLNAGQGHLSTFDGTLDADWRAELDLKFFSVIRPLRAFLPMLRESNAAAVVIVNSLLARQPEPHMVCTSAARAGVQNLAKSLSVELAPRVRVNSVLLGTVYSAQWERRYATSKEAGDSLDDWLTRMARDRGIPLQRMGQPDEPAASIVFLASLCSSFTTGAALEVSGGVSRSAW